VTSERARLYQTTDPAEAHRFSEPITRCVRDMDPEMRYAAQFELREVPNGTGSTMLRQSGYAAIVERDYDMEDAFGPYVEQVARSAFDRTLAAGCDTNLLLNHAGVSMARTKAGTLRLSADDTGLFFEARVNPSRPDVQILRAGIEDGALDECSMAFRCLAQEWDADYEHRRIKEVSLSSGDVSVVNYAANPHTAGLVAIRSRARAAALGGRPAAIELPNEAARAAAKFFERTGKLPRQVRGHKKRETRVLDPVADARLRLDRHRKGK
jgi:HK97 family phage prohead protease